MAIFISSKFSEKNAQYDGIALEYGVNAFSSVDEAYRLLGSISGDVIFADSQVTLTAKEMEMLHGNVYGKADIDGDESGDWYISEISNVKADSTLIIKDAPGSEGREYPYNVNFSKVEVSNSQVGTIEKDAYYTSSVSKKDSQDMVTEKENYKADGSVTVKNSSVGSVINYATVSLNNSSAGAIICKQSYKSEAYGRWMPNEDSGWVDTSMGGEYEIDYSAGGTLNITLDKNADGVYNIGGGDHWYGDSESYRVFGVIDGYNKVTITGLDTAKNPDNGSYICVNGSIVGGQRFLDYYYGMNHWDMDSSGTVKISNGVEVRGAVAYFNSVTIAANSKTGAIINGDGSVSVKYSYSTEKNNYSWNDYTTYVMTVTETISLTGSVTVSDSSVGDIVDYKTVKITNSDTGRITLDTETQQIVKYFSDSKLDEDAEDMTQPSDYNLYYTADGSLTVKIDKNAIDDNYYIGNYSDYDNFEGIYKDSDPYDHLSDNKAIAGYKKVDIAGYTDKKNPDNNKRVIVNGDIIGGDTVISVNTEPVFHASGSATLSNVEARDIKGYTTVKLTDSAVGNVDKLSDRVTVTEKAYKQIKIYFITEKFKKDGSFNASNSTAGNIINYQTVNLLNSSAGNVERNTINSKTYYYMDYGDGYYEEGEENIGEVKSSAAGSFTAKLDKNAVSNSTVGNIRGYSNVTVTGYTDKKNSDNNKTIYAGNITGGDNTEPNVPDYYEKVSGALKLDMASAGEIYGFKTVSLTNNASALNITAVHCYSIFEFGDDYSYYGSLDMTDTDTNIKIVYKSADKVTVASSSVEGSIAGYGNVNVTDSRVGDITLGDAYTMVMDYEINGVYTATKTASVTIKNSQVDSIDGYSKVTLVNSDVKGNINQSGLVKFTSQYTSQSDYSHTSGKWEYKATGSVNITADKNAVQSGYYVSSIYNYEKVTISGYEGKDGKDVFITTGDIFGGASVRESEYEDAYIEGVPDDFSGGEFTQEYATGSVTIGNNVTVNGSIIGYDKVTLTDATVSYDISAFAYDDSRFDTTVANSVTLNGAEVYGSIAGYKNINAAKGNNYIYRCFASSAATTLTVAKGATLKISTLQLDENDKLEVKGTVIFEGGRWDVAADQISGSGEIAATSWMLKYIDLASSSKVKLVDLGNTADGFVSSAAEAADNTAQKAVKWDGSEEYNGWLSGGGDNVLEDTVDYINLTAQENGMLLCRYGDEMQLWVNDKKWDGSEYSVSAGTTYTIKLEREESNSASYELSFLA